MIGRSGEVMVTRCGGGWRPGDHGVSVERGDARGRGARGRAGGVVSERGPRGGEADRAGVDAAGGAGHDQTAGGGSGAAALDVLPHVPGDGDHGVPLERRDAGARAADRRARVAEDDEALRPDGGQGDRRRDRAHRDLTSLGGAPALRRSGRRGVGVPGGPADGVQVWSIATRLGR